MPTTRSAKPTVSVARADITSYRGAEYEVEFIPKAKIEILCNDSEVDRIVNVIASAAQTGTIGDGKIWVTTVERQ